MSLFTPAQQAVLNAAADRILPADREYPGAVEIGAVDYIERQFAGDLAGGVAEFGAGLDQLDIEARARYGSSFNACSPIDQDTILGSAESADTVSVWPLDTAGFTGKLVALVMEGAYADPGNGGNRDEITWKMIGFVVTDKDLPTVEKRP